MDNSQGEVHTELNRDNIKDLERTGKWAMFLAILGFITTGVFFIIGLAAMIFLCVFNKGETSSALTAWLGSSYIMAAGIFYFFPFLKLLGFARNMRDSLINNDQQLLTKALTNLRICFTWIGILVIAGIVLYIIAFMILGASVNFLKDIV